VKECRRGEAEEEIEDYSIRRMAGGKRRRLT